VQRALAHALDAAERRKRGPQAPTVPKKSDLQRIGQSLLRLKRTPYWAALTDLANIQKVEIVLSTLQPDEEGRLMGRRKQTYYGGVIAGMYHLIGMAEEAAAHALPEDERPAVDQGPSRDTIKRGMGSGGLAGASEE
jgi:hypothetical protein